MTSFDLVAAQARQQVVLLTSELTVMQSVFQDTAGGWWCTQVTSATTGTGSEDTLVSAFSPTGQLLGSMTLTAGGHGLSLAVEAGATPIVYVTWDATDLVSFAWSPSTTLARTDAAVTTVWNAAPVAFAGVNLAADRCIIRDVAVGGVATHTLRAWSDVKAGVDSPLAAMSLPGSDPGTHTFQGMATDADVLYELTGDGQATSGEPTLISAYLWSDGSASSVRDASRLGLDGQGLAPNNQLEPEGLAFATNTTGDPVLLLAVTSGPTTNRTQLVFSFAPPGPALPPIPLPREVPFLIELFDKDLNRTAILADPTSVQVTRVKNGLDTATIVIPPSHGLVDLLATPGARVVFTYRDKQLLAGMVVGYDGDVLDQSSGAGLTFTVNGDSALLAAVLAYPTDITQTGPPWPQATDVQTGPAETVAKYFIRNNMIDRLGLPVTIATDQGRGGQITVNGRFKPLSDYLFGKLTLAGLVLTSEQTASAVKFDVRQPAHYPMTLTRESGIVTSAQVTTTGPTATRAVAGGTGTGIARHFAEYEDPSLADQWGALAVREQFVDASGEDSDVALVVPAQDAVATGALTTGLSIKLSEAPAFRFPDDYDTGDWVTESLLPGGGLARTHQVAQVQFDWSRDSQTGFTVTPIIGDLTTTFDRWARTVAASMRQLRDLGSR